MANEFKVKHGLIVNGSGSTVLDVQGSQGQLFSITDSLSGSLFSVGDISGIPILEVFSDDTVKIGSYNNEAIVVSGSSATVSGSFSGSFVGDGSGLTGITPTLQEVTDQGATTTNDISVTGSLILVDGSNYKLYLDSNEIYSQNLDLYVKASQDVVIQPGEASTAHFDASGNVGIGTTSPVHKLDIAGGKIQINDGGATWFGSDSTGGFIRTFNGDTFRFLGSSNNEHLRILSNSNVGIGTTTPTEILTVEGNISASGDIHINNNQGLVSKNVAGADRTLIELDSSNTLKIKGNDSEGSTNVITMVAGGDVTFPADVTVAGTVTAQEFHTEYVSASIIYESGSTKFGDTSDDIHEFTGSVNISGSINVTGDQRQINILGDDGQLAVQLTDNVSGATDSGAIKYYLNGNLYGYMSVSGGSPTDGLFIRSEASRAITFKTNGNNDRMVIQDTGNVGIGTTTPSYLLDVIGSGSFQGGIIVTGSSALQNTKINEDGVYITRDSTGTYTNYFAVDTTDGNKLQIGARSKVSFLLNSSEVLNINDSGNVGIGVTSPSQLLDVAGNINLDGDNRHIYFSNTNVYIGELSNSNKLELRGGGSSQAQTVFLDSSGNLGIGVSSPIAKLDVRGDASISSSLDVTGSIKGDTITLTNSTANTDSILLDSYTRLKWTGGAGQFFQGWSGRIGVYFSNTRRHTFQSAGLALGSGGDVKYMLDVHGDANVTGSLIVTGSLTANGLNYPTSDGSVGQVIVTDGNGNLSFDTVSGGGGVGNIDGTGSADYLTKWVDFNTLTSSSIYEDSSGNIGIGTTSPQAELHVEGDISGSGNVTITRSDSTAAVFTLNTDRSAGRPFTITNDGFEPIINAQDVLRIQSDGGDAEIRLDTSGLDYISFKTNSGTEAARIDHNGRLGIGTTTPAEKLTVEGNISGSGTINVASSITGSDVQIDDWGSVSASLASISASAASGGTTPTLQQVTEQGSSTDQQINITGALTASGLIYPTADGQDKEVLVTDGSGNLTFERPNVYANVKNKSGTTLLKGTPVHASSSAGNLSEVIAASASVASTMPATFVLNQDLADEAEGLAVVTGFLNGIDTSAFSEGDVVYVGADGGYTNVKPTGSSNLIQNLGIVINVDASNGSGFIYGSGRSNDIPNLPVGKVWVGSDEYSVTSSVIHLDETNNRLGVNTITPDVSLHVAGNAKATNLYVAGDIIHTGDVDTKIQFDTDTINFDTAGSERMRIASTGNVGIGTSSPSQKLEVSGNTVLGGRVDIQQDIRLRGTDTLSNQGVVRFFVDSSDRLFIDTGNNGSNRFVIDSSGSVGIGTQTPEDLLHVENGNILVQPSGSIAGAHNGLLIGYNRYDSSKAGYWGASDGKVQNSDGNLYFAPRNINPGNGSYIQLGQRDSNTASDKGTIKIQAGTYNTNSQTGDIFLNYGASQTMLLDGATGYVGIGTTSPTSKLDVDGRISTSTELRVYDSNSKVRAFISGSSDGIVNVSNGTNVGLVIKGATNSPYIGAYSTVNFAQMSSNGNIIGPRVMQLSLSTNTVDVSGSFTGGEVKTDGDFSVNYFNSLGTGLIWQPLSYTSFKAAIKAVDEANFSRTGLGFFTGDDSDTTTDAQERMRITRAGNVGIGTTSPTKILHVSGAVLFQPSSSAEAIVMSFGKKTSSTDPLVDVYTNDDTADRVEYHMGRFNSSYLYTHDSASSSDRINSAEIEGSYVNGAALKLWNKGGATIATRIATENDSYFNGSGNVGIGTTSPGQKLDVRGNIRVGSSTGYIGFGGTDVRVYGSDTSDILALYTSGQEQVRVDADGDLGIGTTSPGAKLHVVHTDASKDTLRLGRSDNSSYWRVNHAGNDFRLYNDDSSGADILFGVNAGGIVQNNKVGIRTASPSYNLDVSGSGNFTDGLTVTGSILHDGDLTVTGTVTAQEFHTEFVSSSILFSSGSTKFGDDINDVHNFTGSINLSGSIDLTGDILLDRVNEGKIAFGIAGDMYGFNSANNVYLQKPGSSGGFNFGTQGHSFQIFTGTTAENVILQTGTTPGISIHSTGGLRYTQHAATNNNDGYVLTYTNGTAGNGERGKVDIAGDLTIKDYSSGTGTEAANIKNNGDAYFSGSVGIGTTTPSGSFQVAGTTVLGADFTTSAAYTNKFRTPAIFSDGVVDKLSIASDGFTPSEGPAILLDSRNFTIGSFDNGEIDAGIKFTHTNNTQEKDIVQILANATAQITVSGSGNVGVGTETPDSQLEVAGDIHLSGNNTNRLDVDAGVRITGNYKGNNGTEYTYLEMYDGGNASINMGAKHPLGYISFEVGNGSYTERMRINNSGNVGIGTTTPVDKLHVDGNVTASAFYGDGTNLTNVQRIPKVEYLALTASIATNDIETLPNSLTYTTASDGYEYLEVFVDGIRLNRTYEYSEYSTSQVRYLFNIPSGSVLTYKSLTLV